jgi:iron(III) transport system substrate-binding protein
MKEMTLMLHRWASLWIGGLILFSLSCHRSSSREVILYTSVDQPVAQPIVAEFEKQTGLHVRLLTDTEATKSIGLAERLRAERDHPQADVWWGNEIFLTINLADDGVLAAYNSPSAADIPPQFKDPDHRFASSGMRLRVIVNAANQSERWSNLQELTDPALKGRVGISRPTAGTTGGHVAALYAMWGDAKASDYFRALRNNDVKLLGGNSVVAEEVGNGMLLAGLTDNDDAAATQREGGSLVVELPDQQTFGTLAVPCTVALVNGAPHPAAAKQLIDFLLSRQVEQQLIDAKFAAYSVRQGAAPSVKLMDIDYRAAARLMPDAIRKATAIMEGRE